jgi:hypothetical protein
MLKDEEPSTFYSERHQLLGHDIRRAESGTVIGVVSAIGLNIVALWAGAASWLVWLLAFLLGMWTATALAVYLIERRRR